MAFSVSRALLRATTVRHLMVTGRCSALERNLASFNRIILQNLGGVASKNYATKAKQASADTEDMFCFQCEQTKNRKGCITIGVCGKTAEVSHLQDLLMHILRGLAMYGHRVNKLGGRLDDDVYDFMYSALFSTLTNVNFDPDRFHVYISQALRHRDELKELYFSTCKEQGIKPETFPEGPATYRPPAADVETLAEEGKKFGLRVEEATYGADLHGVRQMIIFGLKGMATYARHAAMLGKESRDISAFVFEVLDFLETGADSDRTDLVKNLGWALRVGEINLKGMELLDKGHRDQFGTPSPHEVSTAPVPGKAILVSGHDLVDLLTILKATEKTGINVYTHGEMLPAHGYPELRKFKNLVGHFGGAWMLQKFEFPRFPGPIVVTTNCLIEPHHSYKDRIFTLNDVGWPGCKHVDLSRDDHMVDILSSAMSCEGYTQDFCDSYKHKDGKLAVGFGHDFLLANAEKVIDAVKSGALKRIFVVGGCDGSENRRSYYSTLVESLPQDTVVLTLGCAKYRFNHMDLGTLGDSGIPRLLDMGQCNDSYGAVVVASALADAFNTDVNSLPLSLAISWFEQKAVAVLLTLLHLGIKNIRLGPKLPAFLTPNVLRILVDKYNIQPTDNLHPLDDMKLMMEQKAG